MSSSGSARSAGAGASVAAAFAHPVSPLSASGAEGALLHSVRLDTAAMVRAHPPRGWTRAMPNKQWVWNLIQSHPCEEDAAAPAGHKVKTQPPAEESKTADETTDATSSPPRRLLRFSRYDSSAMPLDPSRLVASDGVLTKFEIVRSVYGYEASESASGDSCDWYVNFADRHLFGFYGSALFAQDEWQCMEHPALCSLREYLEAASEVDPSARPLTVTRLSHGVQPTPCLVMNAPREVEIDAVGGDIYGNNFSVATTAEIAAATRLLRPRTHSNIIAMEALKHGRGTYTAQQVAVILQTAIAAFAAAKIETTREYRDMQLDTSGKEPKIVVHTGNWGCGAFGGNVQLMCLLQLVSAAIAGVDRLVYHVLNADTERTCRTAFKEMEEVVDQIRRRANEGLATNMDQLCADIAARTYHWGFSNGT